MINYKPASLQNLAADELLKICKSYALENKISIKNSINILFKTYPEQIKKILKDRLDFYYEINYIKIALPLYK